MTQTLFDQTGNRKYLVARERRAFARAACAEGGEIGTFCLTLAFTGARISEVLALTPERIDKGNCAIVFECLKRRERGIFRAVPVPLGLLMMIERVHGIGTPDHAPAERLWTWCRTTAWKRVKLVMHIASCRIAAEIERACRPEHSVKFNQPHCHHGKIRHHIVLAQGGTHGAKHD